MFARVHWHSYTLFISLRFILISVSHWLRSIQSCIATLRVQFNIFVRNSFLFFVCLNAQLTSPPTDCTILIVSGEEQTPWSSSLYSFLQSFLAATSPRVPEHTKYILLRDERPSLKPVQKNSNNDASALGPMKTKKKPGLIVFEFELRTYLFGIRNECFYASNFYRISLYLLTSMPSIGD